MPSKKKAPKRRKTKQLQTSDLVAALEEAWIEIQAEHNDTPDAVMIIASGTTSRNWIKWGHFAANRWSDGRKKKGNDKGLIHEVMIGGEGLARGGKATLVTLLHEAAHGIASARGVADTSRGARYHNQRFKALGEELALVVTKQGSRGWAHTEMSAAGSKRWAKLIKKLDKAIAKSFRLSDAGGKKKRTPSRMLKAQCDCRGDGKEGRGQPRTIRIARTVFDVATIECGACEANFTICKGEG